MHRYFFIPMISFFIIICGFVIYMQFINEDWKFIGPKLILPESCNDNSDIEFVIHEDDYIEGRSFQDNPDIFNGNQFHAIFLLPCERKDRKFDINLNIESSLLAINKWFFDKSKNQAIRLDKKINNQIDVTFLRVNKTMNWFIDKTNENIDRENNVSEIIEDIILTNKDKFNNFYMKKFIIFFEGWEKRKSLNFNICGSSRFDGKIAIYYTFNAFKKYVGDDIINIKNNKKIFSCTKKDHLNDIGDYSFGDAEATILHEMLHTLGAPSKCANNIDLTSPFHVSDHQHDILNKESGNIYLDYNNDDYYNHSIDGCFDLKNSKYLIEKN